MSIGDTVYVDLRAVKGCDTYDALNLPNANFSRYVCECTYTKWIDRNHLKIDAKCPVLDVTFRDWDSLQVYKFGTTKVFNPDSMVLVTPELCVRYPKILESRNRSKLLRAYDRQVQGVPMDPGTVVGEG